MARIFLMTLLLASGLMLPLAGRCDVIRYPHAESDSDSRQDYPLQLLKLALAKAGGNHTLAPSKVRMQQGRATRELEDGQDIDVMWTMTSKEREAHLLPIRIPIYKGLIGWRIGLVRKVDAERFASVRNLADLRAITLGQGHDWPDTDILRSNGLNVYGVDDYESLFRMLQQGRFDYFPRSVLEIWQERDRHAGQGLVVEPHLLLRYPAVAYYFVNRRNTGLARLIERGLERALADGSFDRLFLKFYGPLLEAAHIDERTAIDLTNPLLPADTPLNRDAFWYRTPPAQ